MFAAAIVRVVWPMLDSGFLDSLELLLTEECYARVGPSVKSPLDYSRT